MKQLKRPKSPGCLTHLTCGRDAWSAADKSEIWNALNIMQNKFCAYCECRLDRKHIEHFITRNAQNQLTFDWNNLFGSCGDTSKPGGWQRYGIYKDHHAGLYNPDHLIKPDIDDPSTFMIFLTKGTVHPHTEISEADRLKANETIRVFNLNNDSALIGRRRQAINNQLNEIEVLYELKNDVSEDVWKELLQDEIDQLKNSEFSTALIHAWRFNFQY